MGHSGLMHCTSNESGEHEVEITYERGFWRWVFRMPERKDVFVGDGLLTWRYKDSGVKVGRWKSMEIYNVVDHLRAESYWRE